ncbi:MAG: ACT domain-containing protein [Pseudomonadota bacterium]
MQIRLKPAEGSVIRTLGLAERRGFRLANIHLQDAVGGCQLLSLVVNSPTRSVQTLKKQIERLHDVMEARIVASDATAHVEPQREPALAVVGR